MDRPLDFVAPQAVTLGPGSLAACLTDPSDHYEAIIDLRGVRWVEPYGLVALAVFAESQIQLNRLPRLIAPQDREKANYLERMGVGQIVESLGGRHNLRPVSRQDHSGHLLELRRFDSEQASDALGELVFDKLAATDITAARAMHQSISELGQNVTQHSGRPSGFLAAQSTHDGRKVMFSIGDSGIGLLRSLDSYAFQDEEEVLEAVMVGGVTSTGDQGRGNGFRLARELLTGKGGLLYAQTGCAHRTEYAGRAVSHRHPSLFVQGTILQGVVDC